MFKDFGLWEYEAILEPTRVVEQLMSTFFVWNNFFNNEREWEELNTISS